MKQVILFDIDHTLFDTEKFRAFLPKDYSRWRSKKLPFRQCMYPEVAKVLKALSSQYTLGIFSIYTHKGLQEAKIKGSGLASYFSQETICIDNTLSGLIDKTAHFSSNIVYAVDDRIDKLHALKKRYPSISTVRIKRGPYATRKSRYVSDYTVANLREFLDIVL